MKKAKYREINLYSYYDFSGMARHLEDMARQGWQLERIGSQFWTYRRCPPTEMRYAVVYFEKASDLDAAPLQEQQDFWEMCRTAGWELAASRGVMQIFRNPDPHAVPIETDPVVQVENVHAAMKKTLIPSYAVLLGCCLLQIWLTVRRAASDPIDLLTDPFTLPSILLWGILGIHIAADLISYFRWLRKARTTAREEGTLLPPKSQRWRQMVLLAFGFLYILLPILLIAPVYGAVLTIGIRGSQYLMKRQGVSPVTNRVLSCVIGCGACFLVLFAGVKWIAGGTPAMQGHVNTETRTSPAYPAGDTEHTYTVYHDPLPLTVEDLVGETAYQKLGKELMSVDELAVLDGGKCILQLRGVRPFLSNKYDLTKHPLYRYTADYDKKYAFDIERFLSHRLKLKPDDAVEVYQADLSGEPVA